MPPRKIRITKEPPLDKRYKIKVGDIYEVLRTDKNRVAGYWIKTITGQQAKILFCECKLLPID